MPFHAVHHVGGAQAGRTLDIPDSWVTWTVGGEWYARVSKGEARRVRPLCKVEAFARAYRAVSGPREQERAA